MKKPIIFRTGLNLMEFSSFHSVFWRKYFLFVRISALFSGIDWKNNKLQIRRNEPYIFGHKLGVNIYI